MQQDRRCELSMLLVYAAVELASEHFVLLQYMDDRRCN